MRQSRYISTIIAYLVFSTIGWLIPVLMATPIILVLGLILSWLPTPLSKTANLYLMIMPPLPFLACVLMYFTAAPHDMRHVQRSYLLSLIFLAIGGALTLFYAQIPYVEDGPSGLYILRHMIPAWGASFFFGLATLTALRAMRSPEINEEKAKRSAS